jgi:hypothetical protein
MQTVPAVKTEVNAVGPSAVPAQQESFLVKAAIAGCVSAVVSASLNGFDVTKIRMQNQSASNKLYTGLIPGMKRIYREEGIAGLAKGIRPSMYRELSYSSIRIGAYEPLRKFLAVTFTDNREGKSTDTNPLIKYFAALISGGGGSALCNPFDLAKTAFQAQLPTPPGVQSALKYNTTFAFFRHTVSEHGFAGLYKGWFVTSCRAGVLTSAQLGSYDTIKNNICKKYLGLEEGFAMHFSVSMLVGVITCTATNPCKTAGCV